MTITPMTAEAAIHNGHMLLGGTLVDLEEFYVLPVGDGSYRWSAYLKLGSNGSYIDGNTFPTRAEALSNALLHGCAPSAAWFQAHYPEHNYGGRAA